MGMTFKKAPRFIRWCFFVFIPDTNALLPPPLTIRRSDQWQFPATITIINLDFPAPGLFWPTFRTWPWHCAVIGSGPSTDGHHRSYEHASDGADKTTHNLLISGIFSRSGSPVLYDCPFFAKKPLPD